LTRLSDPLIDITGLLVLLDDNIGWTIRF